MRSGPSGRTPLQQALRKFLLKTGNDAGTFRISGSAAGQPGRLAGLDDADPHRRPTDLRPTDVRAAEHAATEFTAADAPPATPPRSGLLRPYRTVNAWTGGFRAT